MFKNTETIDLDNSLIAKGAIEPMLSFMDPDNAEYGNIAQRADELVSKGLSSAYYVPSTRFIIEAANEVIKQPEVQEQLPTEVVYRARVAKQICEEVTGFASSYDAFLIGYGLRDSLEHASKTRGKSIETVSDTFLSGLAWATFTDSGALVGGAIKSLQEQGIDKRAADVLENSLGLLAVASIAKTNLSEVYMGLGLPYIDTRYLEVANSDNGVTPSIRFTAGVRSKLKDMYGVGCPANKIQQTSSTGTMLQTYWKSITGYLAPDDATIDLYKHK